MTDGGSLDAKAWAIVERLATTNIYPDHMCPFCKMEPMMMYDESLRIDHLPNCVRDRARRLLSQRDSARGEVGR